MTIRRGNPGERRDGAGATSRRFAFVSAQG